MANLPGSGSNVVTRLRTHHICCLSFYTGSFEERGPNFQRIENKIRSMLLSSADAEVMVIDGVDELCRRCPFHADGRCTSPKGDEAAVRKWDEILLSELGLTVDICLTWRQWHALVKEKAPFRICQKCQWKNECSIGSSLL